MKERELNEYEPRDGTSDLVISGTNCVTSADAIQELEANNFPSVSH